MSFLENKDISRNTNTILIQDNSVGEHCSIRLVLKNLTKIPQPVRSIPLKIVQETFHNICQQIHNKTELVA